MLSLCCTNGDMRAQAVFTAELLPFAAWPIAGPVRDMPLAVCDATTVAPADLVASDLIFPDRRGETYQVRFNPVHRWYWLPEMTTEGGAAAEGL